MEWNEEKIKEYRALLHTARFKPFVEDYHQKMMDTAFDISDGALNEIERLQKENEELRGAIDAWEAGYTSFSNKMDLHFRNAEKSIGGTG